MVGCSAFGCSNQSDRYEGFRLFRFPRDPERRRVWALKSRRDNWTPTDASRLCQAHFDEDQYEKHRKDGFKKLKPNAIPTIFNVEKAQPKFESCVFRECKNRHVKPNARSKGAQLLFFPFPTDARLQQAWLQATSRTPELSEDSEPKICSEHFFPEEFEIDAFGQINLKPYAIPIVLNTTIVEEELAPKRKRPRTSKEPPLELLLKPRVLISLKERWLADAKLHEQVEEDIGINEENESTSCDFELDNSEIESLPYVPSPTRLSNVEQYCRTIPSDDTDLPSLHLLSYVASKALEDAAKRADDKQTGNQSEDLSSPKKKRTKDFAGNCAIESFINQVSKTKSSRTKSRHLIIKEKHTNGATNKIADDPTLSLPSIFIFDETGKNPPGQPAKNRLTTNDFDEHLEKMSVADVEAKHTGVRLKISILTTRNDTLLHEIHRLRNLTQRLISRLRTYKDNVNKSVDNLLVVETVPRCDCKKNRGPPGAPREDLDALFGEVASRDIPVAEESQLLIDHQERLIKRIASIKDTFKDRGKDIIRVVVIQSEDLTSD